MAVAQVVEKYTEAQRLVAQAKSILEKTDVNAEDRQQFDGLMKKAAELKEDAGRLQTIHELSNDIPNFSDADGGSASPDAKNRRSVGGEKGVKTFGEFVQALVDIKRGRMPDVQMKSFIDLNDDLPQNSAGRSNSKAVTGTGADSVGYLIPEEQRQELMSVAAPLSVVRSSGATVIRMRRRQIRMPILDQTGSTAGTPSFFGGITARWEDEETEHDGNPPTFRNTLLTAHKLICWTELTEELLDDADTSLTDFLASDKGFPGAIAWYEDRAFFQGTGVGQPQGIISAPATIAVTRTTGSTIKYDDLANMVAKFMGSNPVWVATHAAIATLMLMNGPSGNASYLWGSAKDGVPNTLLGYPIKFVDKLPAVGSKGDIMLADFSHYVIGDRQAITVKFTDLFRFNKDVVSGKAIHRVDGQPWLSAPITLTGIDGSTTVSPFVVLAA